MEVETTGADVETGSSDRCRRDDQPHGCRQPPEARGCARRARREARHRLAGRLDPRHRPGALRDPALRRRRHDHARRHRHGALAADDARRTGRGRGCGRHSGQAVRRAGAAAARERCHDRVQARRGHRPDRLRVVQLAPARLQRGGLPAPAGGRRPAARDRSRSAARDRRPGGQVRFARRVAAGADGDPRPLRGRQADHGRHRFVPALRQGDGARRGRARARGDHPGAGAHRALTARAAAATRSTSGCTRTTSSSGPATRG